MSTSVTLNLRTRVVSILDVLAKSAIAEISKVIDEGTEELRLEMSRSKKENKTLKRRLLQMEKQQQSARRHGKIRAIARDRIRTSVGDEIRKTDTSDSDSYEEEESLSTDSMFGKEWSINLWKDGELAAMKEEEAPRQAVINEEATQTVDDRPDLFSIKVELFEQNLEDTDPQEGLKISKEEESLSTDSMFGKEWSINLWKDGELAAMKEEEAPRQAVINEEATQTVDDRPDLFSIKVELFEQNLEETDPQEGLKISSCFESESDSTERQYIKESYPQPAPTEIMEEPYARATSAGGRLEQDTLPITLEGTAESHASPAPPQSTAESGDAQPCFLRGQNINPAKGPEGAGRQLLACSYCGRNFSYFISFQKHQQTCSNTSENHSCQKTELAHHESSEIGQKTFKNRSFSCEHCTETFSCSYDLETHQTIHREKQFSCNDCGKCYLEKWRLDSHLCSRTGGKPYKCTDCGNSFSQEVHLSLHQCLHNKVKQHSCVKSGENSSRKRKLESQHRIYREGNFYSCAVCQKSFTNINTFTQYLCNHIMDKSHRCLECGKCFTERSSLLLHQRTIHAGEKPHSCAECGKNFTQKANLQKHQVIHSGEKPYKCLECGKRFTQKGYLKKHYQIHRGVKPYRCRECGKCFYLKTDLNCHERNHRTQVL